MLARSLSWLSDFRLEVKHTCLVPWSVIYDGSASLRMSSHWEIIDEDVSEAVKISHLITLLSVSKCSNQYTEGEPQLIRSRPEER
jgi:hypothetical protein